MIINYYLNIPGIVGSSKDPGHLNEINVLSFSFGTQPTATGSGQIRASTNDFTVVVDDSKANTRLMLAAANARVIEEADLTGEELAPNGTRSFRFKYKFINSYVVSFKKSPKGPSYTIVLNCQEIKIEFGASLMGWAPK